MKPQISVLRKELLILGGVHSGSSLQSGITATLLVYVVQWYGIATTTQEVGLYTGILTSMPVFGTLLTSIIWGHLSDRYGRKPWMTMALTATVVTCVLMGICNSFTLACVILGLFGFLHCTLLLTKTIMAEACNERDQASGFSVLVFSWGVGTILGPFGGVLSFPSEKWSLPEPFLSAFSSRPFLLPFSLAALYHLATLCSLQWLPETNTAQNRVNQVFESNDELPWPELETKLSYNAETPQNAATSSEFGPLLPSRLPSHGGDTLSWEIVAVTLLFGCLSFIQLYADTLFSIFAAAPEVAGGLQYDSGTVGLLNAVSGCIILVYMVTIFPHLGAKLGALNCSILGFAMYIPMWISVPFCTWFSTRPNLKLAMVLAFKATRAVAGSTVYTGTMMVVSNAAVSTNIGLVTALGDTLAGLLMIFAPTMAGWLWTFPSGFESMDWTSFVPWMVPSLLSVAMVFLAVCLPKSLNSKPGY